MFKILVFVSLMAVSMANPLQELDISEDLMSRANISLNKLAQTLMSPHIGSENINISLNNLMSSNIQTSHVLEASKDSLIGAVDLPYEAGADAKKIGAAVPAASAVKGAAIGSALSTPIVLKAVALPGMAAIKTASVLAIPSIIEHIKTVPQVLSQNLKTSFEKSTKNLAEMVLIEDSDALHNEGSLSFNKSEEHLTDTLEFIKAGASGVKTGTVGLAAGVKASAVGLAAGVKAGTVGLAAGVKAGTVGLAKKGLLVAKKGAYVAGRVIMKPIAIIAGANLKMLGTGLAIGGKIIGGTGAGIAKAGTAVKYAGLGGLGVGASAVSWGFDKSTVKSHSEESHI